MIAQRGLTLVEVMVGLVVLVIGVLGILGLQGSTMLGNDFAEHSNVARALTMAQVDFLRRLPATDPQLAPCTGGGFNVNNPSTWCHADSNNGGAISDGQYPQDSGSVLNIHNLDAQGLLSGQGRFRRYWYVRQPGVGGFPRSRTIGVEVQWNDLGVEGSFRNTGRHIRYSFDVVDP